MDTTLVDAFIAVLSRPGAVVTDAATLAGLGKDYWGVGENPGLLLRPRSRDEVVTVVRVAAAHKVSLVTRGGASNCSAGVMAGPDLVMLDLTGMNQILSVDPHARTARVQPGVINFDLQQKLAPHAAVQSRHYAADLAAVEPAVDAFEAAVRAALRPTKALHRRSPKPPADTAVPVTLPSRSTRPT
jgi:FAD/FMN-containing dehydrogenase